MSIQEEVGDSLMMNRDELIDSALPGEHSNPESSGKQVEAISFIPIE